MRDTSSLLVLVASPAGDAGMRTAGAALRAEDLPNRHLLQADQALAAELDAAGGEEYTRVRAESSAALFVALENGGTQIIELNPAVEYALICGRCLQCAR